MTQELLDRLIEAVYTQQLKATGREWDALQHTLGRLDEMAYGDGEQVSVTYDPADVGWALSVARLYGLAPEVSDE